MIYFVHMNQQILRKLLDKIHQKDKTISEINILFFKKQIIYIKIMTVKIKKKKKKLELILNQ